MAFLSLVFIVPAVCLTCGGDPPAGQRRMFPQWKLGEWWEVESTFAEARPMWGAPLSGLDLRHRFEVVDEAVEQGVACWVVEARCIKLREIFRNKYSDLVVAKLWIAKDVFRAVRIERVWGGGRQFVERPHHTKDTIAATPRPLLLTIALPTILDIPVGPRRADQKVPVPWRAHVFPASGKGRVIRQTVDEIVEKAGGYRERVLKVTLSDGSLACNQVWRPDRPWPDCSRTWAGVEPAAPFVYRSRVVRWSRESYFSLAMIVFGFLAQAMFTLRFAVQWIASERAGKSVVPMAFWWLSLSGGAMLLTYAIYRFDPVFILGQACGALIYLRNIWFRLKETRGETGKETSDEAGAPHEDRESNP